MLLFAIHRVCNRKIFFKRLEAEGCVTGKQHCGAGLRPASTSLSRCSDYCADCCGASGSAGNRELRALADHHFSPLLLKMSNRTFDFMQTKPHAGGMKACSRWLSEATPPEADAPHDGIPKGCQRHQSKYRSSNSTPDFRRKATNSSRYVFFRWRSC